MSDPPKDSNKIMSRPVWDCGSSLYDSFELKSFNQQLDTAIALRTLSMPHLREPSQPASAIPRPIKKRSTKISGSVNRLLRSFFRMRPHNSDYSRSHKRPPPPEEKKHVFCDRSGQLSTIPEAPETLAELLLSPELNSVPRRTVSDRFALKTTASIRISCA